MPLTREQVLAIRTGNEDDVEVRAVCDTLLRAMDVVDGAAEQLVWLQEVIENRGIAKGTQIPSLTRWINALDAWRRG